MQLGTRVAGLGNRPGGAGRTLRPLLAPRGWRAARCCVASAAGGVHVRFVVQRKVKFGESIKLVGSLPVLGDWKPDQALTLAWGEGNTWSAEAQLPVDSELEFKCVRVRDDGGSAKWEEGDNHRLRVPAATSGVVVELKWGDKIKVQVDGTPPPADAKLEAQQDAYSSSNSLSLSSDDDTPQQMWQGREIVFMRSNDHSRERGGAWDATGLAGAARDLVEGDSKAASWLAKLECLKRVLVDEAPEMRPELDAVANAYIYTQWVASGAIPCVESGGHRRPNHHAALSQLMFRSLEWVAEGDTRGEAMTAMLARRLCGRLPSFTEEFTQSTPLTRVRDIAHRNDIPQQLKQEIKHTIQNKLHRNAGPEDLVATEAMLARVTATPGEYPDAFVSEFRLFTKELRDFFGAGSLTEMLAQLKPSMDDASLQLLERFSGAKGVLDAAGDQANLNQVMDVLHSATTVRALLASGLSSGLRNDAPDRALAMRQRWRLCEVRAEDYAFVLLSRFINALEAQGGAAAIVAGSDGGWALPIGALVLGLRQVGLSGFEQQECMALERELATWQRMGGFNERDNALRLAATLQRMRRVCEAYCQALLDVLADRSMKLGAALGLDPEHASVFTEAEVRASVVFQLSKLTSLLLKATTSVAGGSPWDVVVAGDATGMLLAVDCLEPGCLDAAAGKDAVLLVASATGDEEVAALGANLHGILLRQDLPHLSHLGVRARQERVPFATCEDESEVSATVLPLVGQHVRMQATASGMQLDVAAAQQAQQSSNGSASVPAAPAGGAAPKAATTERVRSLQLLPLRDATAATSGAKASACGELLRLAGDASVVPGKRPAGDGPSANGATPQATAPPPFAAPDGVVLPFGCMEAALTAAGQAGALSSLQEQLRVVLGSMQQGAASGNLAALDALCSDVQELITNLRIPQNLLQQMSGVFKPGATVIVRSSANVEDLAGMSGAGLYDSIASVESSDPAALQSAICAVWGSLYSRRAVLSRHAARVPQEEACMAVLVQQQLAPDVCFVLHTAHPLTRDPGVLCAELAPGMGETLAAGTRGSPWRLEVNKEVGAVHTSSFANFSQALLPVDHTRSAPGGDPAGEANDAGASAASAVVKLQPVDYSQQMLSVSSDVRKGVGQRLAIVGDLLERHFGAAQDVEGCLVADQVFVVQTRPQP